MFDNHFHKFFCMQYKQIRITIKIDFIKHTQLNSLPVPICINSIWFHRDPFHQPRHVHPTALYSSFYILYSLYSIFIYFQPVFLLFIHFSHRVRRTHYRCFEYGRFYWIVRRMPAGFHCDKPVVLEMTTKQML